MGNAKRKGSPTETGTCYNPSNDKNKHTPLVSTIYSTRGIGAVTATATATGWDRAGSFYAPLGKYSHWAGLLGASVVQRHAASEGISCRL